MLGTLITLFVLCIVAFVLFGVALAVLGVVFGLAFGALGLAVKLLPVLLIGWLAVKLLRRAEAPRSGLPVPVRAPEAYPLTRADRDWLDS